MKIHRFMIYYSGHGRDGSGAWIFSINQPTLNFEDVTLTITEILDIVNDIGFDDVIEITSDSCYSGALCHEAKAWWEKHPNRNIKVLFVKASTYKEVKAVWGRYTRLREL